jgi:D-inositol-3-phosphate glycosyltransferase
LGRYALNAIRKSSQLIAVSEYIRQTALLQGVAPSVIHTIINPVPISNPQPDPGLRDIRTEFHLEGDTPLVVAVGRLDPGKGHLALFEAFSELIQQMPNARLLICGISTSRDNYEFQLRQRVNELQINPYIIFAGQRNDIPAIMRSANVFCLPTELDPCPLVFLEAMAEGIPVVAYYSGGVPEMVLHNQTGLLSYPGDIQTLAANLQKLLSATTYAQRLGESGKLRVMAEFTPEIVANRWLKVLQGIVR